MVSLGCISLFLLLCHWLRRTFEGRASLIVHKIKLPWLFFFFFFFFSFPIAPLLDGKGLIKYIYSRQSWLCKQSVIICDGSWNPGGERAAALRCWHNVGNFLLRVTACWVHVNISLFLCFASCASLKKLLKESFQRGLPSAVECVYEWQGVSYTTI